MIIIIKKNKQTPEHYDIILGARPCQIMYPN